MKTKKLILAGAVCAFLVACGGGGGGSTVGGTSGASNSNGTGGSHFDGGNAVEGTTAIHIPGVGVTSPDGLNGIDTNPPTVGTFQVAGNLENCRGADLELHMNGNPITILRNQKGFKFDAQLKPGEKYEVTVASNPYAPTQHCWVEDGEGTVLNETPKVDVVCEAAVKHVYTANSFGPAVNGYVWTAGSDFLEGQSNMGTPYTTVPTIGLAKHPSNSNVYTATGLLLTAFTVKEKNGPLVQLGNPQLTVDGGNFGRDLFVHPNGKKLYVMSNLRLLSLDIDEEGKLTKSNNVDLKGYLSSVQGIAFNAGVIDDHNFGVIYAWSKDGDVVEVSVNNERGDISSDSYVGQKANKMQKLIFHPNGKLAFSIHDDAASPLNVYSVAPSGAFSLHLDGPHVGPVGLSDIAMDATGTTLFTAGSDVDKTKTIFTRWTVSASGELTNSGSFEQPGANARIAAVHPTSSDVYFTAADGTAYLLRNGKTGTWAIGALTPLASAEKHSTILLY